MRAEPLRADHLRALPDPLAPRTRENLGACLAHPERGPELLAQGRAVLHGGRPVAAWGVLSLWPGVYSAWAWLTPSCAGLALPLTRLAREHLAEAHAKLGAHRIQAEVSRNLPSGVRWALRVGFYPEGLLRRYDAAGGDCWMLSSVRS